MGPQNFIINIENQKWLFNEQEDLCSHGEIYLNMAGTIITQAGMDEEWGISESALALLRTLDKEYICDIENEEGLILHGCGTMLMLGCPISIHWTINHIGKNVILKDFVKVISTDQKAIYYEGLHIELNENEYRRQIVSFALQAKELFNKSSDKIILDEFDQRMYTNFWTEYDDLLNKYK
ncbi:hypothetical protein CN520_10875 [Bacillus cereus]|uniref:hypothetical protein n=1 Tax=Bacillus TaxID=1386 RepID=UPI00065B4A94|nr:MULTISPECIES: hypothetical protein [Bacillus cereus group]KMP39934.1 hypothetical protein TU54_08010 [Bacillus cereus]KXY67236.1 hypothetical protein AT278_27305 [Bacillus cereus]MEB9945736.1 hypothetical protein [Bacillus cereus]PDZ56278.1 hypothetical protein CON15_16175 [Bacillus cereus]PEA97067.1 hypothetical protein CON66_06040 [Bacillus cereus]